MLIGRPLLGYPLNYQVSVLTLYLSELTTPTILEKENHMSDVLSRVSKMVVEHLDVEEDKVTATANFIEDLGADSLDNVELVMAFEEEFDIEIPDDAAETIQTVGDAVKFITEATA